MSVEDDSVADRPSRKKAVRKAKKGKAKRATQAKKAAKEESGAGATAKYPRHTVDRALRIPRAIIEQNAGRECSEQECASYVGVGLGGPFRVEISSGIKYGFLNRP